MEYYPKFSDLHKLKAKKYGNTNLVGFHIKHKYIDKFDNYALQFFYGSPNTYYKISEPEKEFQVKNKYINIHSKYIGNIAKDYGLKKDGTKKTNIVFSNILNELKYLQKLKIKNSGTVLHLSKGHHDNRLSSLIFISDQLNYFCKKLDDELNEKYFNYIILETSNNINHLGSKIEDFEVIWQNLNTISKNRIRFCIDTAHIYTTGYDISYEGVKNYLFNFHKIIGIDKIKLIHLNDSKSSLFSSFKEHERIGLGEIFKELNFLNFKTDLKKKINYIDNFSNTPIQIIKLFSNIFQIPVILERKILDLEDNLQKDLILGECEIYNMIPFEHINFGEILNYIMCKLVSNKFKELSDIYKILNDKERENIYRNASYILKNELNKLLDIKIINKKINIDYDLLKKRLMNLKNIGNSISDKVIEIIQTKDLRRINEIKNDKKYNIIKELSSIDYIGSKKAEELFNIYGIKNINELRKRKDLKDILTTQQYNSLIYSNKLKLLDKNTIKAIEVKLKSNYNILKDNIEFYILGSYVRGSPTSKDIDILVIDNKEDDYNNFLKIFNDLFELKCILIDGNEKYSAIYKNKEIFFKTDIIHVSPESKYTSILYFTGPKYFNTRLRLIAKLKGFKLNHKELLNLKNNTRRKILNEEDIFDILNVKYINPKNRDDISL